VQIKKTGKMMKNFKIIITGGGSGGHTIPALAMIKSLQKYCSSHSLSMHIIYIGSKKGIENKIITQESIEYYPVFTGKLRRYFSLQNFVDIFNLIIGFIQSLLIIKKSHADVLFSTGGFVSVTPVIAARLFKIPIIIHEQTIDAGLANKITAKFATIIALTFEESKKYFPPSKIVITGIPLREDIFNGSKNRLLKKYPLDQKHPIIYFTGGGLGCHILNQTALIILKKLLNKYNIIYQAGNSPHNNDLQMLKDLKISLDPELSNKFLLFDFVTNDLRDIYASADLTVSRSGAGTVNELVALKIPAVFIPLAIAANNEQEKNAKIMETQGGAIIIQEQELTPDSLFQSIDNLFTNNKIAAMKKNLNKLPSIKGNDKLTELIIKNIV
jgi:UDP-N-acetylglucosamine--N-acetylmuramyl-(pentapeptide) pyrophosphoryl-undecaprenol N-acetylglucosamine transferase